MENTISDMITEVEPRLFRSDEIEPKHTDVVTKHDSPIQIVHKAWDAFSILSENEYSSWESEVVRIWLD